jgi:NAD dependent epimerase/dehydratase family enzyme
MSHNYIHKPKKDNIKKTKTLMDNSSKLNSTLDEDLAMARETILAQEAELEEKMEIINSKISENEALKEKISDFERNCCKLLSLISKCSAQ